MAEVVLHQSGGDAGWCIYRNRKLVDEGVVKGDNPNAYTEVIYKAAIYALSIIPRKEAVKISSPHTDVLTKQRKTKEQTDAYLEYNRCIIGRKITYNPIKQCDAKAVYAKKLAMKQRKDERIFASVPEYIAFTDGSCNNLSPYGEGGAAYVVLRKNGDMVAQNSKGFIGTTNNRMELLAIISAVNWLPDGKDMLIATDSQYCINMLDHARCPGRINKNEDLIRKYYRIRESKGNIRFEWVKGHNGNKYNEMVDSLADSRREEMRVAHNIPLYDRHNSPKCTR